MRWEWWCNDPRPVSWLRPAVFPIDRILTFQLGNTTLNCWSQSSVATTFHRQNNMSVYQVAKKISQIKWRGPSTLTTFQQYYGSCCNQWVHHYRWGLWYGGGVHWYGGRSTGTGAFSLALLSSSIWGVSLLLGTTGASAGSTGGGAGWDWSVGSSAASSILCTITSNSLLTLALSLMMRRHVDSRSGETCPAASGLAQSGFRRASFWIDTWLERSSFYVWLGITLVLQ